MSGSIRRPYLDWLRGIGVLIMIEGHALDAWTLVSDRDREGYQLAILIAGIGAPIFLFLAGVAIALAAGSRLRKGQNVPEVASAALRRGAFILGLGFLFRLQAYLISGGTFPQTLLKVDILNIMGVSMMAAALLWRLGRGTGSRAVLFGAATLLIALATPIVRTSVWLSPLPDPIEWYLRPSPGSTTFTLFPWSGFLTGGAAIGLWLDMTRTASAERRVLAALAALGGLVAATGYGASFLPAVYQNTTFWSGSPTFFFLRLGIVIAAVPLAYALTTWIWRGSRLQEFGRASLFVYWIHVEMAYGVLSTPLHRRLPFELALLAIVAFGALLFGLVRLKARLTRRGWSTKAPDSGTSPIPARHPAFPEKTP